MQCTTSGGSREVTAGVDEAPKVGNGDGYAPPQLTRESGVELWLKIFNHHRTFLVELKANVSRLRGRRHDVYAGPGKYSNRSPSLVTCILTAAVARVYM